MLALVRDRFRLRHLFRGGALDRPGPQRAARPGQDGLARVLEAGARWPDSAAAGLCRTPARLWPALRTFADGAGVEPTTSAAERALRPAALRRTGASGPQSAGGARFAERLLTVTATRKPRGRPVPDYRTQLCTAAQRGQPIPSLLPVTAERRGRERSPRLKPHRPRRFTTPLP